MTKVYTHCRYVFIFLAFLCISGCDLMPVKEKYVEIPTPVSCVTWEPTPPTDRFGPLGQDAPIWEQVQALLIDRENDRKYIEGQQAVINGCKD